MPGRRNTADSSSTLVDYQPRGRASWTVLVGFGFHLASIARQPGARWLERISSGAPILAPLLFPSLVILGLIGLYVLASHSTSTIRSAWRS
jgi:hypothetical protein